MTTTNKPSRVDATAKRAIDSLILHGDWIVPGPEVPGTAFSHLGVDLIFVGVARRRVWNDAADGYVWRLAPDYRYALVADTAPEKPARYTIKAGGYYAIAGKVQSSAATTRADKATTWNNREEAEAALLAVVEAAPSYFGAIHEPAIVEVH